MQLSLFGYIVFCYYVSLGQMDALKTTSQMCGHILAFYTGQIETHRVGRNPFGYLGNTADSNVFSTSSLSPSKHWYILARKSSSHILLIVRLLHLLPFVATAVAPS